MLGRIVLILRPCGENEVGESYGEYHHAEALTILCICSSVFRLSLASASHPRMIFRLVSCVFMSPAPTTIGLAARLRHSPRTASNPPGLPTTRRRNGRVCYETLRYQAFRDRSVVAIVVIADPDSPPAPRCRPPTPTRATIETNAGDEW